MNFHSSQNQIKPDKITEVFFKGIDINEAPVVLLEGMDSFHH